MIPADEPSTSSCYYESVSYKDFDFRLLEISGKDFNADFKVYQKLFEKKSTPVNAVIFMFDSCKRAGLLECTEKIRKVQNCFEKPVMLFLANKQERPEALSVAEVCDLLDLHSLRNAQWYIQAICAITLDGWWEGLDWLVAVLSRS